MKLKEKELSIKLRLEGYSLNEICKKTGFSKGSVSIWVRKVKMTQKQENELSRKGFKYDVLERRRNTRLANERVKRQIIISKAESDINNISSNELFLIGVALYWAEGRKSAKGIVGFSNGDPRTIKIMMRFFKEICCIPNEKFRGHIHIHQHLNVDSAEKYWSQVSEIPLNQFCKTYSKPNKSSQSKKDTLPYGTFEVYICNTELLLKIEGWINGMYKSIVI